MMVLTLALILVPFILGVRSIPKMTRLYRFRGLSLTPQRVEVAPVDRKPGPAAGLLAFTP
jgi:hypothetical protein